MEMNARSHDKNKTIQETHISERGEGRGAALQPPPTHIPNQQQPPVLCIAHNVFGAPANAEVDVGSEFLEHVTPSNGHTAENRRTQNSPAKPFVIDPMTP